MMSIRTPGSAHVAGPVKRLTGSDVNRSPGSAQLCAGTGIHRGSSAATSEIPWKSGKGPVGHARPTGPGPELRARSGPRARSVACENATLAVDALRDHG